MLKIEDDLKDYIYCEINFFNKKKQSWLEWSHLISNVTNKCAGVVKCLQTYKTPGIPDLNMMQKTYEKEAVSMDKQKLHQSGFGMMFYIMNYSPPDIGIMNRDDPNS